jgi:hypothetical protein
MRLILSRGASRGSSTGLDGEKLCQDRGLSFLSATSICFLSLSHPPEPAVRLVRWFGGCSRWPCGTCAWVPRCKHIQSIFAYPTMTSRGTAFALGRIFVRAVQASIDSGGELSAIPSGQLLPHNIQQRLTYLQRHIEHLHSERVSHGCVFRALVLTY